MRLKEDKFKFRLAERLRAETAVPLKWIARRLCMGTRGHLAHLLYWQIGKNKTGKTINMTIPLTNTFLRWYHDIDGPAFFVSAELDFSFSQSFKKCGMEQ